MTLNYQPTAWGQVKSWCCQQPKPPLPVAEGGRSQPHTAWCCRNAGGSPLAHKRAMPSLPESTPSPAGQGKRRLPAFVHLQKMYARCPEDDKVRHEHLFAVGAISLLSISVHTQQYRGRTRKQVLLTSLYLEQSLRNKQRKKKERGRDVRHSVLIMVKS